MIWNIFYQSDKQIAWTSTGGVNEDIIAGELERGFSHIAVEQDDHIDASTNMVNSTEDGIVAKSTFDPTFNTTTPALEGTVSITGLVVGTKVYIDNVLKATMTDTTLNLTFNDPGTFMLKLQKFDYLEYTKKITTARQS